MIPYCSVPGALNDRLKASSIRHEVQAHCKEGVLLRWRAGGGRLGRPHGCLELGVLRKEAAEGADAGAKIGLHLYQ